MFPDSPLHQLMHTCVLGQQVICFQPQREEVTVFGGEQAKQKGVTTQVIGWRHCRGQSESEHPEGAATSADRWAVKEGSLKRVTNELIPET